MAEQKRVAYFDYVIQEGDSICALTSNKKYSVLEESYDTFSILDDEGDEQYCLKGIKDCAHLEYKTTWILEDLK